MTLETAFSMDTSSIKFGPGVTREVGWDMQEQGATRVMLVTDPNLANKEPVALAMESLREYDIDAVVFDQAAVEPLKIFTAPIFAVRKLLNKTGTTVDDYDLIEVNEAFAAQTLVDGRELGMDWEKVNVNGGAIALGHPIGCSGTRVLVTLIYALRQRDLKRGLAALCLGGGEAVAMAIELE